MLDAPLIWLFLLLPVAALTGWYSGRKSRAVEKFSLTKTTCNDEYLRSINYLLNEQPDKAIEVFLKMVEVDEDTVETHLALGNLFRRRGEVDRAIRIHQNLIARPSLDLEQRKLALLELSADYMKAGLLDRAENLLHEVIKLVPNELLALEQLLNIYQQEREWNKAIATAQLLVKKSPEQYNNMLAHFFCEQAEEQLAQHEIGAAKKLIQNAFQYEKNSVRASLLLGGIEMQQANFTSAMQYFKRVPHQDAEFMPDILAPLLSCANDAQQRQHLYSYFGDLEREFETIEPSLAKTELIAKSEGNAAASAYLQQVLKDKPSLRGLERMIAYRADDDADTQDLRLILKHLVEARSSYRCRHCGFKAKSIYWRCPSCQKWSTVKPDATQVISS